MSTFQPTGKIQLIRNVDIDVSYTHQYYFANSDAQNNFFASKVFASLENGTYQRKNINTIQVPYQADEIADCKYLRWQNPYYSSKWYYAFVTSVNYVNPGVSTINYTLDVYQTYLFNMQWKQSFVEREHTNRWEEDARGNTIPVVNTEPEGLEYGSEYKILDERPLQQIPRTGWLIFASTKFSSEIPLVIGNYPSGLIYTMIPICTAQDEDIIYTVNGNRMTNPTVALNYFARNTTLVNSLASVVYTPFCPLYGVEYTHDTSNHTIDITIDAPVAGVHLTSDSSTYVLRFTGMYSTAHNTIVPTILIDPNFIYDLFPNYTESKLLMFPYSFIELTTKRGHSMVIKMEYLLDRTTGNKIHIAVYGTISSANKMLYAIRNYMCSGGVYNMSNGLSDDSNSSLPILDDYSASYLQANSNSLRVADSNARYSQLTNIDNAYRSYETAMSRRMAEGIKAGSEIAGGLISGVAMGTLGGLAGSTGMMAGGLGSVTSSLFAIPGALADYMQAGKEADTDYWNKYDSATTDYANAVAITMAKKSDAQQIPPSSKSLGGDYIFNMANDCDKLYLIRKTIYPEYADKLESYFKQYGYKVNKLEVPNFYTRASWNYIKMTEPNVYGNIPMDDLMEIRDIFIKGITLWHGDYIGDYTRNNDEI